MRPSPDEPKRSPVTERLAKEVTKIQSQLKSKGISIPAFNGKHTSLGNESVPTDSRSSATRPGDAQAAGDQDLAAFLTIRPPKLKLNLHGRTLQTRKKKQREPEVVFQPPVTPPPLTMVQRLDMLLEPSPLHPSAPIQQRGRLNLTVPMSVVLNQQDSAVSSPQKGWSNEPHATAEPSSLPSPKSRNSKALTNSFSTHLSMSSTFQSSRHDRFRKKAAWPVNDWRMVDAEDQHDVGSSFLDTSSVMSSIRSAACSTPIQGLGEQLPITSTLDEPADLDLSSRAEVQACDSGGGSGAGSQSGCAPENPSSLDGTLSADGGAGGGLLQRVDWVIRGDELPSLTTSYGRPQGIKNDVHRSAYLTGMFPMARSDLRKMQGNGGNGLDGNEGAGNQGPPAGLRSARPSMAGRSFSFASELVEESSLVDSILDDYVEDTGPSDDARTELQRMTMAVQRGLGSNTNAFFPTQPSRFELAAGRLLRQSGRRLQPALQSVVAQPSPMRSLLVTPTKVTLPDSFKDGHTSPHSAWGRTPSNPLLDTCGPS